ncbi:MAG: GDSL family lipase, partial [Akkermansia sp.]|nr:GDSL family lipase [Akkermansia sp.]
MNFLSYILAILLGSSSLAFSAPSIPASALPATLKPEPHQRDPYDWNARHEAVKKRNRAVKPEYVMIGDSITHHWGGEPSGDGKNTGSGSWEKLFGPHAATNMGFGFDYVDNAYYRVQNGELDGISPRVIIVLLGTNNLGHRKDTPQACADNIRAFVRL